MTINDQVYSQVTPRQVPEPDQQDQRKRGKSIGKHTKIIRKTSGRRKILRGRFFISNNIRSETPQDQGILLMSLRIPKITSWSEHMSSGPQSGNLAPEHVHDLPALILQELRTSGRQDDYQHPGIRDIFLPADKTEHSSLLTTGVICCLDTCRSWESRDMERKLPLQEDTTPETATR